MRLKHLTLASIAALLVCATGRTESQADRDLRDTKAKLAQSEAARIALSDSIFKLTQESAARSAALNAVAKTAERAAHAGRIDAAETAAENAHIMEDAANRAAKRAVTESDAIKEQIAMLQETQRESQAQQKRETDNILITVGGGFATVLIGLIFKAWADKRDHEWQKAAQERAELMATQHRTELREVKTEARQAYDAGNHINEKLEKLGLDIRDGKS